MDFNEYQGHAARTSSLREHTIKYGTGKRADESTFKTTNIRSPGGITPAGERLIMAAFGLGGEAGETVDYLKKAIFHGHELDKDRVKKELGDVLWYVAEAATTLGLSLDDVAKANVEKLRARYGDQFSSDKSINRKE